MSRAEVAVVGAGAAGLMAAIQAARAGRSTVALDGARTLGAKILVSGGGRCNVTHDHVDERAFNGSTPAAVRSVLRRFGVAETIAFFQAEGVALEREETGKLFPATDRARTVLDALLGAAERSGVALRHPFRVEDVRRTDGAFVLAGPQGVIEAERVVLATGGRSLPRSGSDGHGYRLARSLGHTVTDVFPALVPLRLPSGHPLVSLPGVAAPARVDVTERGGRRLASFEDAVLCTHFGLSGPAVLDASRHWIAQQAERRLVVDWVPRSTEAALDERLRSLGPLSVLRALDHLPERLARALATLALIDPATPGHRLTRDARRRVVAAAKSAPLPITGDRGYDYAEVTAGGVPLAELHLGRLASRVCPGLFLCGEVCDVDGRIGGYNFQWAWASGFVAGRGAASS